MEQRIPGPNWNDPFDINDLRNKYQEKKIFEDFSIDQLKEDVRRCVAIVRKFPNYFVILKDLCSNRTLPFIVCKETIFQSHDELFNVCVKGNGPESSLLYPPPKGYGRAPVLRFINPHTDLAKYDGICLSPAVDPEPVIKQGAFYLLNYFAGWKAKIDRSLSREQCLEKCSVVIKYINTILANGDTDSTNKLLSLFAQIIQNPPGARRTMLALVGGRFDVSIFSRWIRNQMFGDRESGYVTLSDLNNYRSRKTREYFSRLSRIFRT